MTKKPFGWIIKSREDFVGCENDPWVPQTRRFTVTVTRDGGGISTELHNKVMADPPNGLFSKEEVENGYKGRIEIFPTRKEAQAVAKELSGIYRENFFFKVFPVYLE